MVCLEVTVDRDLDASSAQLKMKMKPTTCKNKIRLQNEKLV